MRNGYLIKTVLDMLRKVQSLVDNPKGKREYTKRPLLLRHLPEPANEGSRGGNFTESGGGGGI